MSRYRRANTPGATYFFTVVTYRRRDFLCDADVRIALREAIAKVREQHPFLSSSMPGSCCRIIYTRFGLCRRVMRVLLCAGSKSSDL